MIKEFKLFSAFFKSGCMNQLLRKLFKHKLTQNIFLLYGVQFSKYLLPLFTIPYLARVLGPTSLGLLFIAQAYVVYIGMLVEYGFNIAGTGEVARYRHQPDKLIDFLAGVMGAEFLLVLCGIGLTFVVQQWIPSFKSHPTILWAGMFWMLTQALSPIWYFAGLERLGFVALMDMSVRILYSLGIIVFIKSPEDAWKVLGIQGVASSLSMVIMLILVYREVPFRFPTKSLICQALKKGWTMFLFVSADKLYKTASAFILSIFVSPKIVGYYAGADKFAQVMPEFLNPITQAFYPKLSNLAHHSPLKAAKLARVGIIITTVLGCAIAIAVYITAPLLVRFLLGAEFEASVPVLRILSLQVPLIAVSKLLGIQWILPLGMDRTFSLITLSGGGSILLLAVLLTPLYAHIGMAWAVVGTEFFIATVMYLVLRWQKLDPFSYAKQLKIENLNK